MRPRRAALTASLVATLACAGPDLQRRAEPPDPEEAAAARPVKASAAAAGSEQRAPWTPESAQALLAAVEGDIEAIRACVRSALKGRILRPWEYAILVHDKDAGGYVSAAATAGSGWTFETERPSPLRRLLEACLADRARTWTVPSPPAGWNSRLTVELATPGAQAPLDSPFNADCHAPTPEGGALRRVLFSEAERQVVIAVEQHVGMVRVSGRDPHYTRQALENDVQGTQRTRCTISRDGAVTDCRVLQSLKFMDQPILEAISTWRTSPPLCNGHPAEVRYSFNVVLKLSG